MEEIILLNFEYSYETPLDMYYGFFLVNGEKKDIRTLSKDEIKEFRDDGISYCVPLVVKRVDKFNLNDKIVYHNSIILCDDLDFLNEVNKSHDKHYLIITDEENPSTLNRILNGCEVIAECLKTYPDEDDMRDFYEGCIKLCDVRLYYKGSLYLVGKSFNTEYFKIIN